MLRSKKEIQENNKGATRIMVRSFRFDPFHNCAYFCSHVQSNKFVIKSKLPSIFRRLKTVTDYSVKIV